MDCPEGSGHLSPGCRAEAPADNGLVAGLPREGRVTTNGLRFAYLEAGSGPLVLLSRLAGHAAYLGPPAGGPGRGWVPRGGTVAARLPAHRDPAVGLLRYRHAGGGCPRANPGARRRDPCLLVGQDWGASTGYQVLAAFPEVVRSAVVMAVPHPAVTRESMLRPSMSTGPSTGSSSSSRTCRSRRCAPTTTRSLTGCGTAGPRPASPMRSTWPR